MGKKRVIKKTAAAVNEGLKTRVTAHAPKKKLTNAILYIQSTYNNTRLVLTDPVGNVLAWSSSGALGFTGAKKGTTFAASKVGELMSEKAQTIGIQEVDVVIKGIGSGRESALRSFTGRGINLNSIKDETPVPFNGPKPKRARRV